MTSQGRDTPEESLRLYVGTYARGGGAGLHLVSYSEGEGWSIGPAYSGARNASFGTYSARHGLYYFVDEQAEGALAAYRETRDGWQRLARVPTQGSEPCYVALDADQNRIAVANYGSGSVAVFRLDDRGCPLEPPTVRENAGSGPVNDRQDGPHAHCACFSRDGRWLYHVDLGTDEILGYPIDPESGAPGAATVAFAAPAGSGPRHLGLHPVRPLAILASELASTLTVLSCAGGRLSERQTVSTLPDGFCGDSLAGHLSINAAGDRVYVTNRGHDSIAVFAWNETGTLELLQHVASGGASPRTIVLLEAERQLWLANEEDGTITGFDIRANGTLSPLETSLRVPGAVFLLVAASQSPAVRDSVRDR